MLPPTHSSQSPHGSDINIHEPVDAVGQAALLVPVQRSVFDVARDAFLPAELG